MRNRLLSGLAAAAMTSCATDPGVPAEAITAFIASANLESPRTPVIQLNLPRQHVTFFTVGFGPQVTCDWSQCPAGAGLGLRRGDHLGWLTLERADGGPVPVPAFFELARPDSVLWSQALHDTICVPPEWYSYCHYILPDLLAGSGATPLEPLQRLADGLVGFIDPHLAELLLAHTTAGWDRQILGRIATLPVYQGDAYHEVRAAAAARLASLP